MLLLNGLFKHRCQSRRNQYLFINILPFSRSTLLSDENRLLATNRPDEHYSGSIIEKPAFLLTDISQSTLPSQITINKTPSVIRRTNEYQSFSH